MHTWLLAIYLPPTALFPFPNGDLIFVLAPALYPTPHIPCTLEEVNPLPHRGVIPSWLELISTVTCPKQSNQDHLRVPVWIWAQVFFSLPFNMVISAWDTRTTEASGYQAEDEAGIQKTVKPKELQKNPKSLLYSNPKSLIYRLRQFVISFSVPWGYEHPSDAYHSLDHIL